MEWVDEVISAQPLELPIGWDSPFWPIMMGIEHERIHLETSSVLFRELPLERVRVITPPIGGAFGGKQDPWPLMAGALAAQYVNHPVRLSYSRRESFDASPKRHPYQMVYRVGVKADGTLTGLQLRIVANTGAYDADGYYLTVLDADGPSIGPLPVITPAWRSSSRALSGS